MELKVNSVNPQTLATFTGQTDSERKLKQEDGEA
jgi:hypothetical protein